MEFKLGEKARISTIHDNRRIRGKVVVIGATIKERDKPLVYAVSYEDTLGKHSVGVYEDELVHLPINQF